MSGNPSLRTHTRRTLAAAALGLLMVLASLSVAPRVAAQVGGATPPSGTVGPASGSTTSWAFDPVAGAGSGGTPIEVACAPGSCSKYALTVKLPAADNAFYHSHVATLTFRCEWNMPTPTDVDCFSFSPSGGETGPGKPDTTATGANFEEIVVNDPQSGDWSLRADAAAGAANNVTGKATLTFAPLAAAPVKAPRIGDAKFANFNFDPNFQSRDALGRPDAGEPSVGVDPATGKVMYMAGNQVTQLTYNTARPPAPTALDVTPVNSKVNEDAILFTDAVTHRTWALGLLLAGSHEAISDDDGATWAPAVAFAPPAFPDHETLGSGPYHDPAPAHTYPRAVYYCAQAEVEAFCGRSDDGGNTFSGLVPSTALWNGACSPIHGHVRVGPTGIVYVPNESCTDTAQKARGGVAVSVDNGQTFKVSMPPDSSPGTSDPSVMEGPDGTVYFGYQAASGHPMMATATHDANGTLHWKPSIDVGAFQNPGETEDGLPSGVQNTEFAEVITGDAGRAAFAFLGTSRQGGYQAGDFTGTWYLFVSYTFDGGRTWRTVNATPNDPVQRGCVWNGGLVNACRNMLDFNDIGMDKQGRVYVAYTDGCTTSAQYSCDTTPGIHGWNNATSGDPTGCSVSEVSGVQSTSTCTFARLSAIVRQVCGRGLVAASDPGFNEGTNCLTPAATTPIIPVAGSAPPPSPNTSAGILPYGASLAGVVLVVGAGAGRRRRRRSVTSGEAL